MFRLKSCKSTVIWELRVVKSSPDLQFFSLFLGFLWCFLPCFSSFPCFVFACFFTFAFNHQKMKHQVHLILNLYRKRNCQIYCTPDNHSTTSLLAQCYTAHGTFKLVVLLPVMPSFASLHVATFFSPSINSVPLSFASINCGWQCFFPSVTAYSMYHQRLEDLSFSDIVGIYHCPPSKKERKKWSRTRSPFAAVVTHSASRNSRANADSLFDATSLTAWKEYAGIF